MGYRLTKGQWVGFCDVCGGEELTHCRDYCDGKDALRANGWTKKPILRKGEIVEEWIAVCPKCNKSAENYKKPFIKKMEKMSFPTDIINAEGKRIVCRQCSSCHGCR